MRTHDSSSIAKRWLSQSTPTLHSCFLLSDFSFSCELSRRHGMSRVMSRVRSHKTIDSIVLSRCHGLYTPSAPPVQWSVVCSLRPSRIRPNPSKSDPQLDPHEIRTYWNLFEPIMTRSHLKSGQLPNKIVLQVEITQVRQSCPSRQLDSKQAPARPIFTYLEASRAILT